MKFGRKRSISSYIIPRSVADLWGVLVCVGCIQLGVVLSILTTGSFDQRLGLVSAASEISAGIRPDGARAMDVVTGLLQTAGSLQGGDDHSDSSLITALGGLSHGSVPGLASDLQDHIQASVPEFQDLLGATTPQSYLILLQNTNEVRPNGGFFGSYIHLTRDQGRISEWSIRDSYLPGFDRPGVGIQGPERLDEFLPDREIHFVGANKIGFTYADGGHIKQLYELAYPEESLRGVIFVRLDRLLELMPDLSDTIIQRQFINAYAGSVERDSWQLKSNYLMQAKKTLQQYLPTLIQTILQDPSRVTSLADIYLTDVTGTIHTLLRTHDLTTRFEETLLYTRDSNISFTKTDGFVEKSTQCIAIDCDGDDCTISGVERLDFAESVYDEYECVRTYEFVVPQNYRDRIAQLEREYEVSSTGRENRILGIDSVWGNRGLIYLSDEWLVSGLSGQIDDGVVFDTSFGQGISYNVWMEGDQQSREVKWRMVR